jgi:pimeloyl-ACP methyl ester carboxylesterase
MLTTTLTYESHGTGTPVVLLHGLTFDRTSWRPIVERLGDDLHTVAIDLPAHGDSGGAPCPLDEVAAQVHAVVDELGIDRPVVVGHSMSGAVALIYAAAYPTLGVVDIDNPLDVRPFAAMVKQLEPALRGPGFAQAFEPIQRSMRLDLVQGPLAQQIRQDVVVGYWQELLDTDVDALQRRIETEAARIDVPALLLFGQRLADGDRAYIEAHLRRGEVEEWDGDGHCLHLVEPDRFATRLRDFVAKCRARG